MKKALLLLGLVVSSAGAFALPYPTNWQPVLACDNGAAVVDVNTYERRMVQLVIRDGNIAKYLRGKGDGREFIVSAELSNGIFNPSDFSGSQANAYMSPATRVYREGNGLKVQIIDVAHYVCTDYRENDYYCAEGYWTSDREIANWYFQSCR